MSVIGDIVGEILMWPVQELTDRMWSRFHRHEPPARRWLGGTVLVILTVLLWVAYIGLLLGIVVGIFLLVAG